MLRINRTGAALAAVTLASCLVGCGGSSGSSSASTTAALSTAAVSTSATPATTTSAAAPAPAAPQYVVSGWLPHWARTHGDAMIDAYAGTALDEVNLFGIGLEPDGSLAKVRGIEDRARIDLIRARGGQVIPTIYDVHDSTAIGAVLADPVARARAIREMLDLLDQGGYDGIDIDFEHAKSSNRDEFSRFVADLGREVQRRGKIYSVTVPGKRRDQPSWAGYDYAALGAAADRFKIMTYGYSGTWTNYPGGPIAPTDWIEKVLDYAVTQVPREKIQLGIPFYGYDWPSDGSRIRSVTYLRSQTLLASTGATVRYDPARGEAYFTYTDQGVDHTVWFSEERSIAAKADLVRRYRLLGLSIWALGYGEAPVWDSIRATLK